MKKLFYILFSLLFLNKTQAQNLVTNGDFSAGNTSFTTGYILDCTVGGAIGEARYCVGTNPNAVHNAWSACGDHTTGTGNMMILNGTSALNVIVWQQEPIAVIPNTCYKFCVWATSVYPDNPAKIKLKVNGATQNFIQISSTTCAWQQVCGIWNSGTATTATLTIIDEDTNPGGNDLAIDDISFIQEPTPCTFTLPLTWLYIKSFVQGENNVVEWGVNNAVNNANFVVEKSSNSILFYPIETLGTNTSNIYKFKDYNSLNGSLAYYRIKQIDVDGRFSYSDITTVFKNNKQNGISVIENPVTNVLRINMNNIKGVYFLQIFNITGSKLYQEKLIIQTNNEIKNIPTASLNNGMCFVKLLNNKNEIVGYEKFIKK